MNSATNKNKKTSKIILGISLGIVILLLGYSAVGYTTKQLWPFSSQSSTSDSSNKSAENTPIRSDDQLDTIKDEAENNNSNTENSSDTAQKKSVHIGVTYADVYDGNVEIRSFVSGVIEGTGTCKATLEQNGQVITKSSKAFIDSTTTQCEPIYIPINTLPSTGTWKVKVSYSSPSSEGVSDSFEVNL